jgi:Phytanoyl-CoA dioxygenase (PhyH)
MTKVTQKDIDNYKKDGVICLRNVVGGEWLERLHAAAQSVMDNPEGSGGIMGPSQGQMVSICFLWRNDGEIRDFVMNSDIGEVVGEVIGADTVRLFHDHLFAKPAQSPKIMAWHCDATAWPVTGEMAPNIWIALSPVDKENGRIEFLGGYHRHCIENGIEYGMAPDQGDGFCPNFEEQRDNPDFPFEFLSWDLEPGDAVVFHPATPHFSKGNDSTDKPRIGLALRMFGEDTRWNTRAPYKMPIPGIDYSEIKEGTPVEHDLLPVIWTRPTKQPATAA